MRVVLFNILVNDQMNIEKLFKYLLKKKKKKKILLRNYNY